MEATFNRIEDMAMNLAVVSIITMMVVITVNTVGRYFFNDSITWAIPSIELYIFGGIIFLSAGKIQKVGGNVSTTAFVRLMSTNMRRYGLIFAYILTEIFLLAIIRGSAITAVDKWVAGAKTAGIVRLPTSYSWFIVSVGLAILFIRILIEIYRLYTADDPFGETEEGPTAEELATGEM